MEAGLTPAFLFADMVSKYKDIELKVESLIEGILSDMGYELIAVEYLSGQGRWILRLYIDREGGVTIDDCARVSGEIGDLIDVQDLIPHAYVLEVSSPGLNRPLTKENHFLAALGERVKIKTGDRVQGRHVFTGDLTDCRDGRITLETDDGPVSLSLSDLERAHVVYDFG